ncbi:MAG: hypothetical protein VR70_04520 [Rhodospirillaceae bacterium BRH_c57]|nr:MAG: hypothetical protein VR70_04520 [Rhodospirillaceae bacterium BRH_c57]
MNQIYRPPSLRQARILVTSDDALNAQATLALLRGLGVRQVLALPDGNEVARVMESFSPDMIVMDLNETYLDSWELCRQVRQTANRDELPVIIQTAEADADDRARAFDLGANDVVAKPLRHQDFVKRVRLHLETRFTLRTLLDMRERLTNELAMADGMLRHLQPSSRLLAEIRAATGIMIEAELRPGATLGGNLWGVTRLGSRRVGLYVLDCSGGGIVGALNVFRLHTLIDRAPYPDDDDPAAWLAHINGLLARLLPTGQFATLLFAVLDPDTLTMNYASAGAPGPIYEGADLGSSGVPLGILRKAAFTNHRATVQPNTPVLLCNDGLVDAASALGWSLVTSGAAGAMGRLPAMPTPTRTGDPAANDLTALTIRFEADHTADPRRGA